jgi:FKBP-type peptidyl-prolyl cis-trans isomerase FkpA
MWVLGLAVALAGCDVSPTSPAASAPFNQTDLQVGTGDEAVAGRTLTVEYTGWLFDPAKLDFKGLVFDTSMGRDPFVFTLGAGQVIEGWDQGLVGMRVGGIRRLTIPPSLGYGESRNNSIPPNATLLFEVELIAVE